MSTKVNVTEILSYYPSWNFCKFDGLNLLFYKISLNSNPPKVTACVKVYPRNARIVLFHGTKELNLESIETEIGVSLNPINSDKIRHCLKYLDSCTTDLDAFELNIVAKYPELTSTCRFCFVEDDANNCLEPITIDLMRAFNSLESIDFSLDPELPSKCCRSCSDSIMAAFNTQDLVRKSEQKLVKFFKDMRNNTVTKDEDEHILHDEELYVEAPVKVEANDDFLNYGYEDPIDDNQGYEDPIDDNQGFEEPIDDDFEDKEEASLMIDTLPRTAKKRKLTEKDGYQIITNSDGKTFFTCTKCNSSFSRKTALDYHFQHSNAHIDESDNLFLCPECGERFYDAFNVRRHLKKVHDTKEFPCEYCGREYNDYSMRLHLKKHSSIYKSFKCNHCPKIFHANYTLQEHIRKMHRDKREMCLNLARVKVTSDYGSRSPDCKDAEEDNDVKFKIAVARLLKTANNTARNFGLKRSVEVTFKMKKNSIVGLIFCPLCISVLTAKSKHNKYFDIFTFSRHLLGVHNLTPSIKLRQKKRLVNEETFNKS